MCRIAEVLISLQQAGNIKYIGWILQLPCTTRPEIIQILQEHAKCMEDELYEWKSTVKYARHMFYELNYYTTLQLLSLRKELGAVKQAKKGASVSPSVLALLESISPQVTSNAVCDVIQDISLLTQKTIVEDAVGDQPMDSSKAAPSVSEEIIASVDLNTSRPAEHSDNPLLSEDEISEEERAIMAFVTARIGCPKVLVLKAFENCRGIDNMDKYDYMRWCNNNIDQFKFDEEGDISDEDSYESDEESSSSDSEPDVPKPGKCMYIYQLRQC